MLIGSTPSVQKLLARTLFAMTFYIILPTNYAELPSLMHWAWVSRTASMLMHTCMEAQNVHGHYTYSFTPHKMTTIVPRLPLHSGRQSGSKCVLELCRHSVGCASIWFTHLIKNIHVHVYTCLHCRSHCGSALDQHYSMTMYIPDDVLVTPPCTYM